MSLYNMLNGMNPMSGIFLSILNLDSEKVGRFRDVYIDQKDGENIIGVYTRNGGGNRECWEYDEEPCTCPGCCMDRLTEHPDYVEDFDDDFDCTYATIIFRVPPAFKSWIDELISSTVSQEDTPSARYERLLGKLQDASMGNDPQVVAAKATMEPYITALRDVLKRDMSDEGV